ncbi:MULTISPECIES: hypothetical protein [unclassified Caballeronia]|uniref:hypothetical protein n=1 Tax=unclassified Caballeronia TaxID=2646786 RepID=UPI002858EE36|nr:MULTISPECIES: hypothetical protein [unclassified Caballeronia]MDR5751501.1 hypothetical protein [Caballeronia sp. LZ024]MDR5844359.1 hypothetical protein [Caballeronia sp. LZ031]
MSAKVTGPIVDYLNRSFWQAWDDATGQSPTQARATLACRLKLRPEHGTPVVAQVLRTQSQHGKGGTKDIPSLHIQAVNNTTKFVYIENQYFRYMPFADKLHTPASPSTPASLTKSGSLSCLACARADERPRRAAYAAMLCQTLWFPHRNPRRRAFVDETHSLA